MMSPLLSGEAGHAVQHLRASGVSISSVLSLGDKAATASARGAACGSNRSLVVELKKEVAQWRGSESEDGDFKSGPAKGATR
jgi:hypothetical protein